MKKILIFGISGQAGSYLAELLLKRGDKVSGVIRRSSSFNTARIDYIFNELDLYYGDLSDGLNIYYLIDKIKPDYIINAGAMSHVRVSFDIPIYCADVTAIGTLRILEAIRKINPAIRFLQFSSSEMFGKVQEIPQTEKTPFHPRSPYGCSKVMSYWCTRNYREAYNIFASNAIIFNMESPRRGGTFVTKKICDYVKKILKKKNNNTILEKSNKPLQLGNLYAKRDWGQCENYMEGIIKIIEHTEANDFILATGVNHTIKEWCEFAFKEINIDLIWKGKGIKEKGIDKKSNDILIEINEKYMRPSEVDSLLGSSEKIQKILNWKPCLNFKKLVSDMVWK